MKAPPVTERPCCLACGRRLRPNYDSERTGEVRTGRSYQIRGLGPVEADTYGAKQDTKGRWYVDTKHHVETKTWRGTFGSYGEGFFCGLTCAYRWAKAVATVLAREGRQLVLENPKPRS